MNIVFRVDASIEMGIGHVMRCLTLADALRDKGAQCHFVCREHPGHLIDLIIDQGHQAYLLPLCQTDNYADDGQTESSQLAHAHWLGCDWPTDVRQTVDNIGHLKADWLIVDHYALDEHWEQQLRPFCNKIMVIDDLADRHHDCVLLLDQTFGRLAKDYERLVSAGCTILTGAKYALLRPEFAELRDYSLTRRKTGQFKNLLISMGGVDKDNATGVVLRSLKKTCLPKKCHITVVMGVNSPWLEDVKSCAEALPWQVEVKVNIKNMAQIMADSDLAIGAAGSTSWERCCLGVPTLMIVLADNQEVIASALQGHGAATTLGKLSKKCILKNMESVLIKILNDIDNIKKMSIAASDITNGRGVYWVVDTVLLEGSHGHNNSL